nr:MAG TPA: hypothetical protein [Caudoviricetes sp.]
MHLSKAYESSVGIIPLSFSLGIYIFLVNKRNRHK